MAVRALIFDFGGVLCFHPSDSQIARGAALCGVSPEVFLAAFWGPNRWEYDAGRIEPEEYWRIVGQNAGVDLGAARTPELIALEIDFWSRFDQRVLAWVRRLRDEGVRTAVLSNLPRPLGEHLRAIRGFLDPFDHVTFSYELKLVKPDRAIYEDAIRGLGVAPQEALFLDDRSDNVEGARDAGLQAELYRSWEDFRESSAARRYGLPEPA